MADLTAHGSADLNPVEGEVDDSRRKFLLQATIGMGVVGVAFTATPFIESWLPSERARALGGPTEVDISKIEPGQMIITIWRRQPIYVTHRTPDMMKGLLGNHDASDSRMPLLRIPTSRPIGKNPIRARTPGVPGADRYLHAPGLPAEAVLRCRRSGDRGGPSRARLALPLPWLAVRHGGTGLQGLTGLGEPAAFPTRSTSRARGGWSLPRTRLAADGDSFAEARPRSSHCSAICTAFRAAPLSS